MTRAAVWLLLVLLAPLAAFAQAPPAADPPLVVESLECRGNVITSCRFILGHLYLSEGDRLDEEEVQNAKLRLLWLRNFSSVSIYLEKGSERGRARVVVEVVEASAVNKELTYGFFSQNGSVGQLIQGRWTEQNLFGNGKVLDFKASLVTPFGGDKQSQHLVQLSYIDPNLFDSKRYYFSTDLSFLDLDINRENDDLIDVRQVALNLNFGRRVWDFSYFTAGFQYRPVSDRFWSIRQEDGEFEKTHDSSRGSFIVSYGWNSRDDQYFPTRGSSFGLTVVSDRGRNDTDAGLFYSNTWTSSGGTTWIAAFGAPDPFTRIEIQRRLEPFWDARQARMFLQLGVSGAGRNLNGEHILSGGFTAGVRFDSAKLGVVTLYVLGQTSFNK
jgi:outer membrane translocation and assembly module TamA